MPDYYEEQKVKIFVEPCLQCGSTNIQLWDDGFNDINSGGGRCLECKHEVRNNFLWNSTKKQLAEIWNKANNIGLYLLRVDGQIASLKEEREKIINLHKNKHKE